MDRQNNENPNNQNNSNVTSISQHQKAHIPCPTCKDRLYVDNPELELFNTLNVSMIVATHKPVQCKNCANWFVPAITNQCQVMWGMMPIEKPEDQPLIVVPSIDPSKLKLSKFKEQEKPYGQK